LYVIDGISGVVNEWKAILAQTSNIINAALSTSKAIMEEMSKNRETLDNEHQATFKKLSLEYAQIAIDLIANVKTSFDSTINQVSEQNKLFIQNTAGEINALVAKWMTEVSSHVNQTSQNMEGIVNNWGTTLTATSATINTVLTSSENLVREVDEEIKTLSDGIKLLQQQAIELSEQTGAPVHLGKTTNELRNIRTSLEMLIANVTQNQEIKELSSALNANSNGMNKLQQSLQELGMIANKDGRMVSSIDNIKTSLSALEENLRTGKLAVNIKKKPSRTSIIISRLRRKKGTSL